MNRSSTDRAEARLSLTIFLALSFLSVGLFTLSARSPGPGIHPLPPTPDDISITSVWNNSGAGTSWNTAGNWNPSGVPNGSQFLAQFAAVTNTSNTTGIPGTTWTVGGIELTSARTVGMTIGSSGTSNSILTLTIAGGTINSVENTILHNASSFNLVLQANNGQNTPNTLTIGLGNAIDNIINIDGSGNINLGVVLKDGAGHHLTLSGAGSGVLTLSGANTYSGGTTINAGKLTATANSALGTGDVTVAGSGSVLTLSGIFNNYISDTATVNIASGAVVALNQTGGSDTIGGLILGGNIQTDLGTYGSTASMAQHTSDIFFTGPGTLTVTAVATPTPTPTATPTPAVPTATTSSATNISAVSTILNGSVNPNMASTTVYFEYGTDTNYGHQTLNQIFVGSTDQSVSAGVGSLMPSTTYHYRIVATNSVGTTMGNDVMFVTAPPPNPFTACDLVIYRVGDGSGALAANAASVFLDEYTTSGGLVQSISLPTAGSSPAPLTAAGNSTTEGMLNRSPNGLFLAVPGYDAVAGTATVSGTTSTTVPRAVALFDTTGNQQSYTTLGTAFSAGNIRSATTDGSNVWAAGSITGVVAATTGGNSSTTVSTTNTSLRNVAIFSGQLYASSGSGTVVRLGTVGTGTPTTTGQTITSLPGFPITQGISQFFFADLDSGVAGVDTVYVADQTANVISKYSLIGGMWVPNNSVVVATPLGLTGQVSGTGVTLYITTASTLFNLTDKSGYNGNIDGTLATLATAGMNTAFRGIALTPVQCGTPPPIHFDVTAPASAVAGSPFSFTVTAKDQSNQIVTDYAGTVHFTKSDNGAGSAVPADYTFVAGDNGTHTFTNGVTFVTAGNQTITATDTVSSLISGTSNPVAVTGTEADHLAVSAPGSATAGAPFSITVTARDQFNNTATGYTGTVHFTKSDSGAGSAVPADYTFLAGDNGIHTFGNGVTFVTVGNQTVTATDTSNGTITGTSSNVAVSAGTATHFTVSAPASATANTPLNFTVTALDQFNNTATGYGGTVHFTSSDVQAVLPADSTLTNGTRIFSATLNTAGNQTITATDKVTSSITGTSNNVSVSGTSASHFAVSAPANATAGTPFSITVTALDQFNNTATGYTGTVHFTKSDSGAGSMVPANYTFVAGDSGIHMFTNGVTFVTASNETVTATDTGTSSITGTSNNVLVSATTATHFTVTAPGTVPRGTSFNFTVMAQDQFGNTATGYGGTVHFTSSDGAAILPADNTLINGSRIFSATLNTAGNQTITATDTLNGSITGTSNNIDVSSATHFSVSAPGSATAGTPFSFTVTALDASNQTVTNYSGTVHFTKSDNGAGSTVPADYTFVAGDNGTHTFTNGATLVTAGNQTITATDTVSSITGTSSNISVTAIAATHLAVSAPANATAGIPFSITVTAQDPFNNTATGYRGTAHFTKSDNGAGSSVPPNYTFTAGDNGVHTFTNGVTFVTAGNQTVTATDTVTSSITGTSNNVSVSAATATHFSVTAPANATAGTPFNFTVTAFDQFNNIATGYSGTVHFTKSDSGAGSAVPADYTFVAGDDGIHTFTDGATFVTAGNQTITATDKVTSSITGTSNSILVSAATATHFSVSAPANATAGSAFNFTVTAKDQFNNTATGYGGTAHFTSTDGQATLPANSTLTNGTGTFSTTLRTSGNQTITSTDTVTSSITGTSNNIAVTAGVATHFAVSAPANATAGMAFSFTVTAQDQFGNTATGYAGTVHFTSSDAQAVLPANSTLASGTGTFSATLKTAGNQTITATDTVTSSITGSSSTIVVSAGVATHFIVSAPAGATPNVSFSFTVTAVDQFNNIATGYAGTVHFTSTDGSASLPANSTLTSGTGTFNATLVTPGNQTITATDTVTITITGTSNVIVVSPNAFITSPAPGSVLPAGSSVRFDWSGGIGTTAYWLVIGDDNFNTAPCGDPSKVGGSNVFSSGSTGGLYWVVGGLPTDGRTLYVRLWSKINNVWYSPPQDYVYTASGTTPYTPTISPNGGTFTTSVTVTLTESTPCTTVYYTINGGDPTTSSTLYTAPFNITGAGTKVLKVRAFKGSQMSAVATATFTIH